MNLDTHPLLHEETSELLCSIRSKELGRRLTPRCWSSLWATLLKSKVPCKILLGCLVSEVSGYMAPQELGNLDLLESYGQIITVNHKTSGSMAIRDSGLSYSMILIKAEYALAIILRYGLMNMRVLEKSKEVMLDYDMINL